MAENNVIPHSPVPRTEPELRRTRSEPKGVLQKNLKNFVYLGAALLVIVAAIFSSTGKKTPRKRRPKGSRRSQSPGQHRQQCAGAEEPAQAEQTKEQQQAALLRCRDPALASATPAQQAAAAAYGPTGVAVPAFQASPAAQPDMGSSRAAQPQLSPEQQQAQQIAAKERERADESRFASNLVLHADGHQQPPQNQSRTAGRLTMFPHPNACSRQASNLVAPRAAGDPARAAGKDTSGRWRQISIQLPASPISSMKVQFSTRY